MDDTLNYLGKLEDSLITEYQRKRKLNWADKNKLTHHPRIVETTNKWCSTHKTSSHSANKCFNKQRTNIDKMKKDNLLKNKLSSNFLIVAPKVQNSLLSIFGKAYGDHITLIVDTGAESNDISRELLKK